MQHIKSVTFRLNKMWLISITIFSAMVGSICHAAPGVYFEYKDWEVACDNTGTCRAAGYQADENKPISLLLERAAGVNAALKGKINIDPEITRPTTVTLYVGQQNLGMLKLSEQGALLSSSQVAALLPALQTDASIVLKQGQQRWQLSSAGSNAVLLKMDEFQKRAGTQSALIKKGQLPNTQARQATAVPKIAIPVIKNSKEKTVALNSTQGQQLVKGLRTVSSAEQCEFLYQPNDFAQKITLHALSPDSTLVEFPCWMAAYNSGTGFWLMDHTLKNVKQVVSTSADDFSRGRISEGHKGRGVADCSSSKEWAWNGQRFVQSYAARSNQCKGFLGGAWTLPTYVSEVVEPK